MSELDQAVIDLHNIARQLEQVLGQSGLISEDIRKCADRLSVVIKRRELKGEY